MVSSCRKSILEVSTLAISYDPILTRIEDITAYNSGNWTVPPSALTKVNGQPVTEFLVELAQLGYLQDPDALYNNLMFEMAFDSQSTQSRYTGFFALAGRFGYFYPGANTTIEFENGTISTYQNYAEVVSDFGGVVDGPSFFQKFCTGPHFQSYPSPQSVPDTYLPPPLPPASNAHGYPTPKVMSADFQVGGYFLDDPAYSDVAVLTMVSFDPNFAAEFQNVIETLIAEAKAAGKTKIVIDLSSNGGGDILLGYDAFRQFFPQIVQDGFSRFRKHERFDIASKGISEYSANFTNSSSSSTDYLAYQSALNFRYDLNQTDGPFLTYEDKFKPQQFNGDNFTQIMRWNLEDDVTTVNPVWGIGTTITGYGYRKNFTQPFAAENIIMASKVLSI